MKSLADGKVTISTALDNSGIEKDSKAVEDSARKTAMKLAAEYRKAGMSQSEALKKAWSEIERTTSKSSKKSGDAIRKNMGGATQSVVGSLGGLNAVAGKLMGVIAGAFSVYQIAQFGAACIELGSDVAEVQNVVDTSFGGMAYKMEEFADTAITSFGMSELAAKKTGSTYMAMARGMGVAEDAASDMAIELTGLSGDVASFFNLDQEQAAYKLRSIFTGETEALKDLGVVMTQANLQQYALSHGMNSNIQAMSQAEKVALQYSFVVDSLRLAAGDFARTQDSWANQTRILAMQWQEFMSIIGQALTTVLLPVVKMLNTIVAALINMANTFNSVISALFGGKNTQIKSAGAMVDANAGIAASAADAADNEQALADAATAAGKAAKSATLGIDELNIVQQDTAAGGGSGGTGGAGGGGGSTGGALDTTVSEETGVLEENLQRFVDKVLQLWAPLKEISFDNLAAAFDTLKKALEPFTSALFAGLEWAWYNLFVPLAKWTIEDALPVFLEVLAGALNVLSTVIQALQPFGEWLWNAFLKPLAEWTGGAIISVLEMVRDGLNGVSDWISTHEETIQTAITWIGSFALAWGLVTGALAAWNAAVTVWNSLGKIAATVTMGFGKAIAFLTSPTTLVIIAIGTLVAVIATKGDEIQAILQKVDDFLQNIFAKDWTEVFGPVLGGILNGFFTNVKNIWDSIKRVFDGIIDFVRGVFTGDWKRAWEGVKNIFGGIFDGLVALAKAPLNMIIGLLNGAIGAINSLIGGLNSLRFDVPDWVPVLGGKTWGFNVPTIPTIPYLAQGAVLPANREFLAVLGDQRRGTNVEAPLDIIKQALAEVLAQTGGAQPISLNVVCTLDGETVYRSQQRIQAGKG
ncbi:MAG TPA: hypothetical protein H9985_03860, partial [Candidatus Anaerofilum faecale]|nr:hypothetical protein [Candidatus Anaerofilum faecale]